MNRLQVWHLALPLFLMGNTDCDRVIYQVELTPQGNGLERVLTLKTGEGLVKGRGHLEKEDARVSALSAASRNPADVKGRVFRGAFQGKLPADVGGAGWFLRSTSLLGSAALYAERFKGGDDAAAQVKAIQGMASALVDDLDGWLAAELKGRPGADKLHRYMDTTVRADAANVLLYLSYLAPVAAGPQGGVGSEWVAGMYLAEHGYLPVESTWIPDGTVVRKVDQTLTAVVRHVVLQQLGMDAGQPLPAALEFLSTPARAESSLKAYLKTTPDFAARQKAWEAAPADQRAADGPDPLEVMTARLAGLGSESADSARVVLHLRAPPFASNGQWDARTHTVSWAHPLRGPLGLSGYCMAQWSEPDRAFQKEHLGRVVLDGSALSAYVQWRQTLSVEDGKQWDSMLQGLTPGPGMKKKLETFHGNGAAVQGDPWEDGRGLLLQQLASAAR